MTFRSDFQKYEIDFREKKEHSPLSFKLNLNFCESIDIEHLTDLLHTMRTVS